MTIAKYKQKKLATMAESHGREHRKTGDIPHTTAKPGTWQDGVEATAVALYSAMFDGGTWPKPHADYPNLNKLVEAIQRTHGSSPCTPQS